MSKLPPKIIQEYLNEALSDLLDHFSGALILVRDQNGGAIIVAGGSSTTGRDGDEYRELIQAAPGIIRAWRDEAELTVTRELPEREMN